MSARTPTSEKRPTAEHLRVLQGSAGSAAPHDGVPSFADIDRELEAFEAQERERLGLAEAVVEHWFDANPQSFSRGQRRRTTILFGGLTHAHDYLISGALAGLGYDISPLDVPDNEALQFGKEFGNRGQCNPTYFTVGNLIKHLTTLRDEAGLSTERIIDENIFVTAGACGPCRFGTYATEYRKALRDAGFDGFRVLLFQQQGGLKQACGEGLGLQMNRTFFKAILNAVLVGDILNAMGYRIRPYEVVAGATDKAMEECKQLLRETLSGKRSLLRALWRCRKILRSVEVNRLQAKPKVTIIGEFWAMTTEGDGNYRLQRFLESEGAEVEVQLVTGWLLYLIWQVRWDTRRRQGLRGLDEGRSGLAGKNPRSLLIRLWWARKALLFMFGLYGRMMGLTNYHLPDMEEIATISDPYYDNHLRGGEGHMEVGKLIQSVVKRKAHMVISVKPFGCMPSSGVSDGVQSLITAKYPEAIFLAIETTGDGAVNAHSRIQMDLFKARRIAEREYAEQLDAVGWTQEQAEGKLATRGRSGPLDYPTRCGLAGTAARLLAELAP